MLIRLQALQPLTISLQFGACSVLKIIQRIPERIHLHSLLDHVNWKKRAFEKFQPYKYSNNCCWSKIYIYVVWRIYKKYRDTNWSGIRFPVNFLEKATFPDIFFISLQNWGEQSSLIEHFYDYLCEVSSYIGQIEVEFIVSGSNNQTAVPISGHWINNSWGSGHINVTIAPILKLNLF